MKGVVASPLTTPPSSAVSAATAVSAGTSPPAAGHDRHHGGWHWGRFLWRVVRTAATTFLITAVAVLGYDLAAQYSDASLAGRNLLEVSECLLPMPEQLNDLFRPPVDCSFCAGITEVAQVEAISQAEFAAQFAGTGRPLIVTNAAKSWPAMDVMSHEFLQRLYNDVVGAAFVDLSMNRCNFFQYRTSFRKLSEVFALSNATGNTMSRWYVGWSNCRSSAVRAALRQLYSRPAFLDSADVHASRTDWLFIGSPGPGADLHHDAILEPSWQAQLRGRKQWQLRPAPECLAVCRGFDVTLSPGDVLVIDTHRWFHKTTVLGDDISIAIGSEFSTAPSELWDDFGGG